MSRGFRNKGLDQLEGFEQSLTLTVALIILKHTTSSGDTEVHHLSTKVHGSISIQIRTHVYISVLLLISN